MGRLKVEMVKMEKESNLQVTFSKRRAGLFKKASELCTLCGAEAAIIVFSPGKKAFSFGHPSVDEVLDRFLAPNDDLPADPNYPTNYSDHHQQQQQQQQLVRVHQQQGEGASSTVDELNMQITFLNCQLENEKKHTLLLDGLKKGRQGEFWWETPTEELGLEQLLELKQGLEGLKERVSHHINIMQMEVLNIPPPPPAGHANLPVEAAAPIINAPMSTLNHPNIINGLAGGQGGIRLKCMVSASHSALDLA
ncbi:hypothetical protein Dimus_026261 [Dionaea muscipula]